ncbi:uncharacterized protein MYCFIDRAFT_179694 [Pseudocercospora fijiensis CIRAD86]|uniref:Uncharacterized protein n=1 Tax=Pseudocercospora fijiensis (strain CIRAD86) TaxID=383855 RepID=M3AJY1_PSEFD|nr:uncharacterized protein MYCFIDRAFT_179694 [Pseudocercospora fijiensis CIRAD86]EME77483.1 hypothetical protein MYCFIDRAFT_179694 [Pseudocercospora fijiensis CIRAD86]
MKAASAKTLYETNPDLSSTQLSQTDNTLAPRRRLLECFSLCLFTSLSLRIAITCLENPRQTDSDLRPFSSAARTTKQPGCEPPSFLLSSCTHATTLSHTLPADNAMVVQTRQQRQRQLKNQPEQTESGPHRQPQSQQKPPPQQPPPPPPLQPQQPPPPPAPTPEHPMRRFARMMRNNLRALTIIAFAVCLLAYFGWRARKVAHRPMLVDEVDGRFYTCRKARARARSVQSLTSRSTGLCIMRYAVCKLDLTCKLDFASFISHYASCKPDFNPILALTWHTILLSPTYKMHSFMLPSTLSFSLPTISSFCATLTFPSPTRRQSVPPLPDNSLRTNPVFLRSSFSSSGSESSFLPHSANINAPGTVSQRPVLFGRKGSQSSEVDNDERRRGRPGARAGASDAEPADRNSLDVQAEPYHKGPITPTAPLRISASLPLVRPLSSQAGVRNPDERGFVPPFSSYERPVNPQGGFSRRLSPNVRQKNPDDGLSAPISSNVRVNNPDGCSRPPLSSDTAVNNPDEHGYLRRRCSDAGLKNRDERSLARPFSSNTGEASPDEGDFQRPLSANAGLNNPRSGFLGGVNVDRSNTRGQAQQRRPSWEVILRPSVRQLRRRYSDSTGEPRAFFLRPQYGESSKPQDQPHQSNLDEILHPIPRPSSQERPSESETLPSNKPGRRRQSFSGIYPYNSSLSAGQYTRRRRVRNIFSPEILCIAIIILAHVLGSIASGMFYTGRTTGGHDRGGQTSLHATRLQTPPFSNTWSNNSSFSSSSSQRKPKLSSLAVVFPLQAFRNAQWESLAFAEEDEHSHPPLFSSSAPPITKFSTLGLSNLATICPFPFPSTNTVMKKRKKKDQDNDDESKIWIWMNVEAGGGGGESKFRKAAMEILKEIFALSLAQDEDGGMGGIGMTECKWEVLRILEFFEEVELGFGGWVGMGGGRREGGVRAMGVVYTFAVYDTLGRCFQSCIPALTGLGDFQQEDDQQADDCCRGVKDSYEEFVALLGSTLVHLADWRVISKLQKREKLESSKPEFCPVVRCVLQVPLLS